MQKPEPGSVVPVQIEHVPPSIEPMTGGNFRAPVALPEGVHTIELTLRVRGDRNADAALSLLDAWFREAHGVEAARPESTPSVVVDPKTGQRRLGSPLPTRVVAPAAPVEERPYDRFAAVVEELGYKP